MAWCGCSSSHELSCSTLNPVSTGMGDRLRARIPPQYVTKPTRLTQLSTLRGCWINYYQPFG